MAPRSSSGSPRCSTRGKVVAAAAALLAVAALIAASASQLRALVRNAAAPAGELAPASDASAAPRRLSAAAGAAAQPAPGAGGFEDHASAAVLTAMAELLRLSAEQAAAPEARSAAAARRAADAAAAAAAAERPGNTDLPVEAGAPPPAVAPGREDPESSARPYTHQTCYLQSDESELCEYENLCYDGEGPVALVAEPVREPRRVLDYTHECFDARFYEPSALEWSNCHWAFATQRKYATENVVGVSADGRRSDEYENNVAPGSGGAFASASSVPLGLRRWGPMNRGSGMIFRELSAVDVLNFRGEPGFASTPAGEAAAAEPSPGPLDTQVQPPPPTAARLREALDVLDAIARGGEAFPAEADGVPDLRLRFRHLAAPPTRASADTAFLLSYEDDLRKESANAAAERNEPAPTFTPPDRDAPMAVEWLDGALWLADLGVGWEHNPFHYFSKMSLFFDAQRNNATPGRYPSRGASYGSGGHPNDGFINWQIDSDVAIKRSIFKEQPATGAPGARNRALFRQGAQWGPLPPIDYAFITRPIHDFFQLPASPPEVAPWFAGILKLSMQPHTKTLFHNSASLFSHRRLLCAKRAVIVGTKPRIFTGRSDAIVFRNAAYKAAKVQLEGGHGEIGSSPRFPPRRITLLERAKSSGRTLRNEAEVKEALRRTGMPVVVIPDMGRLGFEEQVRAMAETGILVAAHGAALANLVFLPAHAVVIELFPYGMKKLTYANIASLADVAYFPLYASQRPPPGDDEESANLFYSKYYYKNCAKQNLTSFDAIATHACNQAGKLMPVQVDIDRFERLLEVAIDNTGAFSLLNPAWASEAKDRGIEPPTYEQWVEGRPEKLIGNQHVQTALPPPPHPPTHP